MIFTTSVLALSMLIPSASGCSTAENGAVSGGVENDTSSQIPLHSCSASDVTAGPIRIAGRMPISASLEGKKVYLYETEGKDDFVVDSTLITNGQYVFDLEDAEVGLYRFGTSTRRSALGEIILDPREKELHITHAAPQFVSRLTFGDSKDNEALTIYRRLEKKHEQGLSSIRRSKEQRSAKLQKIRAADLSFKTTQDSLAALYPDTFFANMVSHLQSDHRMDKNTYWDDLDFTDEHLIHSTVYVDRIEDYMRTHASTENTGEDRYKGFYNAVDRIAAIVKEGGNDRVLEFMLYSMSEGFYKSDLEEISYYVIDNYFYGDACGDSEISELFKMKAAGLRNLKIGRTPPEFILPDDKGGMLDSKEVVEDNEMTLLIFWASFCHKCEEEIPILASVHQEYSPKGFEVIGISVDLDEHSWMEGIRLKGAPGYNVSDLEGWAGEVAKEYRVTSTPVMFLVDKKGELLLKPKRVSILEQYLETNLN